MKKELALKAEEVSKTYSVRAGKETPVISGLSLEIFRNDFAAITGPSGAGKSTLLYLLGSLDSPDTGAIWYYAGGQATNYKDMPAERLSSFRNKSIGFVFQFHHLLPEFTALENVMMPALIAGENFSKAKQKAVDLIEITGVGGRLGHKPMELSGGEQQRIAIARALINNPGLVLADEPTGNLDTKNSAAILDLIQGLREEFKLTFVVATHSRDVAAIAGRRLVIVDGKIVEEEV